MYLLWNAPLLNNVFHCVSLIKWTTVKLAANHELQDFALSWSLSILLPPKYGPSQVTEQLNLLIIRLQNIWFLKRCSLDQAEIDYYYYYNFCFGVNNTARKIFHNVNLSFHAEIEHVHWFSPQGLYLKENLNNLKIINFLFYFWSSELFFSNVNK